MAKEIPLSQGKVAIVDDEDYQWLGQWKWHAVLLHGNWYAMRKYYENGRQRSVSMHRQVLGFPPEPAIDHQTGNTLDNRRSNLRPCSHRQNQRNRRRPVTNTSGFKGVIWDKDRKKWSAQIKVRPRNIHLGQFDDPIEAAKAYNAAALAHFGEFARLNPLPYATLPD